MPTPCTTYSRENVYVKFTFTEPVNTLFSAYIKASSAASLVTAVVNCCSSPSPHHSFASFLRIIPSTMLRISRIRRGGGRGGVGGDARIAVAGAGAGAFSGRADVHLGRKQPPPVLPRLQTLQTKLCGRPFLYTRLFLDTTVLCLAVEPGHVDERLRCRTVLGRHRYKS